jgi:hypothetical protein
MKKKIVLYAAIVLLSTHNLSLYGMLRMGWDQNLLRQIAELMVNQVDIALPEEKVDFTKDIVQWNGRTYYFNRLDRERAHYLYGDITQFMRPKNPPVPIDYQAMSVSDMMGHITDYVVGYNSQPGTPIGLYPIPLDQDPEQIISLITRQRIDKNGTVQAAYGDSALDFMATIALVVKATGDAKTAAVDGKNPNFEIRRELLDHLMHLHVDRHPEGIRSRLFGGSKEDDVLNQSPPQ